MKKRKTDSSEKDNGELSHSPKIPKKQKSNGPDGHVCPLEVLSPFLHLCAIPVNDWQEEGLALNEVIETQELESVVCSDLNCRLQLLKDNSISLGAEEEENGDSSSNTEESGTEEDWNRWFVIFSFGGAGSAKSAPSGWLDQVASVPEALQVEPENKTDFLFSVGGFRTEGEGNARHFGGLMQGKFPNISWTVFSAPNLIHW